MTLVSFRSTARDEQDSQRPWSIPLTYDWMYVLRSLTYVIMLKCRHAHRQQVIQLCPAVASAPPFVGLQQQRHIFYVPPYPPQIQIYFAKIGVWKNENCKSVSVRKKILRQSLTTYCWPQCQWIFEYEDFVISSSSFRFRRPSCLYFQCYTGDPPEVLRADESRVRCALTQLYNHMDQAQRAALWRKQPDKDVTAWNPERNKIAAKVQEKVIDDLWEKEKKIADKLNIKPPKRSASKTGTVAGRYDKLAEK